jgi:hypothetical protein
MNHYLRIEIVDAVGRVLVNKTSLIDPGNSVGAKLRAAELTGDALSALHHVAEVKNDLSAHPLLPSVTVSRQVTHAEAQLVYCAHCNTRYYVAQKTWTHDGPCDCSWGCCEVAHPTNRWHKEHITSRTATEEDLRWADHDHITQAMKQLEEGK